MAVECILGEHHPKNALPLQLSRAFSVTRIPLVLFCLAQYGLFRFARELLFLMYKVDLFISSSPPTDFEGHATTASNSTMYRCADDGNDQKITRAE
jgi:hypothetical protein